MDEFESEVPSAFPSSMEGPDDPTFGGASSEAFFGGEAPLSDDPFGAPAENVQLEEAPAVMFLGDETVSGAFDEPAYTDDFTSPANAPEPVFVPAPEPEVEVENPKVAEMREAMRLRLKETEEKEALGKKNNIGEAALFLETLYKTRDDATERRKKNNREEQSLCGGQEAKGSNSWERIIEYIDFTDSKSNKGLDMTRYKNVLFAAKAKNVPIAA